MTALEISKYIIQKYPDKATNLRVNKLLYLIQGLHFQFFGGALFDDDFEAWTKGPVIPKVYREYKSSGAYPISIDGENIEISETKKEFVDTVLAHYSKKSTEELVNLSRLTNPWRDNFGMSINLITKLEISDYFRNLGIRHNPY